MMIPIPVDLVSWSGLITDLLQPVLGGSPIQTEPGGGYYHFEKCFADTRITVEPLLEIAL